MKSENQLLRIFANSMDKHVHGVHSICSAHQFVVEAAMLQARTDGTPLLLEATSNQVNQFGGYVGMNPAQFVSYMKKVAKRVDFPFDRIILGGDHLGPYVWRSEKAEDALEKAKELVRAYVLAGFTKIHLDPSMRCADDPGDPDTSLDKRIIAERTASLCHVAESASNELSDGSKKPLYVIGSEVPLPGGAHEALSELQVTSVEDVQNTIEMTKLAFFAKGLESAWKRVIALVVQPGVEFDATSVIDYDRLKTKSLSRFIEEHGQFVFEAHSTDYQTEMSLKNMIEDHFAILKVGPGLTFAFREAVFALESIEVELLTHRRGIELSRVQDIVDQAMRANTVYWQTYYQEDEATASFLRKYSYSDRIRYYWQVADVTKAIRRLINNLSENPIPLALLGQYMPVQYQAVREKVLENKPIDLIHHKIMEVTEDYSRACSFGKS